MRAAALFLAGLWAAARASGGAVALDAGGAANEPSVTAAELRAFMRQTTRMLEALGAGLANLTESNAAHGVELAVHGAALANLAESSAAHGAALADLAESTITPAVAARVEACARATAIAAVVLLLEGGDFRQCSAVPFPVDALGGGAAAAGGAESTFFLSSAHCFFNKSSGLVDAHDVKLSVGVDVQTCALWAHFFAAAEALDIAVIACARPMQVPPTRVSVAPFMPHARAVLLGHSRGMHANDDENVRVTAMNASHVYVPHVRFTRLAASMQLPQGSGNGSERGASAAAASRGFTEDGLFSPLPFEAAESSRGFTGHSPAPGMSGGAVVDTRCGVFGLTERSSVLAQGGMFVRLTPTVVARVAAAAAAGRAV